MYLVELQELIILGWNRCSHKLLYNIVHNNNKKCTSIESCGIFTCSFVLYIDSALAVIIYLSSIQPQVERTHWCQHWTPYRTDQDSKVSQGTTVSYVLILMSHYDWTVLGIFAYYGTCTTVETCRENNLISLTYLRSTAITRQSSKICHHVCWEFSCSRAFADMALFGPVHSLLLHL